MRRRLPWIIGTWLCCQLSLLTAAPMSLLSGALHASDSVTCTCAHAGATECPMHHSTPKKSGCECRNTTDPDAGAVLSMLGPIAVLADARPTVPSAHVTQSPDSQVAPVVSVVVAPDGPPPRA